MNNNSGESSKNSGEAREYSDGALEQSGGASENFGGASGNSDGSSGDGALRLPTVSSFLDVVCAFTNEATGAGEYPVQTAEVSSHGASTSGERSGDHGDLTDLSFESGGDSGSLRADARPYNPLSAQSSSITVHGNASGVRPYSAPSSISVSAGSSQKARVTNKKLHVPNDIVGAIIGKGGQIRLRIQEECGAKIVVARLDPRCPFREVDVFGTSDQIDWAVYRINEILAEKNARNLAIDRLQQFQARPSCGWTPGVPPMQRPGPGGYQARPQSAYGQPPAYGQHSYPSASYGVVNNTDPDAHTSSYGSQGESAQAPPVQPASVGQEAYNASQQPCPNPSSYLPQPGYGVHLTSQAGNGTQPPAEAAYGVGYGAPPMQQPPAQAAYGVGYGAPSMQQPPAWSLTTPTGYGHPPAVLPGYPDSQLPLFDYAQLAQAAPRSSYGSAAAQAGYGAPPFGQPGNGQASSSGQPGYGGNPAPGAHGQFGAYSGPTPLGCQDSGYPRHGLGGSSNEHQQRHGETGTTRFFKTRPCKYWDKYNRCYLSEKCNHAHGLQELVRHPLYKSEPCMMLMLGYCRHGENCFYRHDLNM